ncbi:cellulose binding domain-containing protein [Mucilaginibacter sp. RCC_168]|uniref:cellulose binding domain-containing protein n=1 Tax=unclassified Mucilaginibacter TaxID=2617802 RepID=UPI00088AEEDF|nr:cellulose binding domain-containing protein [Mucilaginibacter sp. OK268]SDP14813.1 gliding motility-associated C-terminal domain-containing protein [Mucilaginibacter sp. OK268]
MERIFTLNKLTLCKRCMWPLIFYLAAMLISIDGNAQTFVHPGVAFNRADMDQLKANIIKEPWLSAYNTFKSDYRSQLSYSPSTPQQTVTRAPDLNNGQWKTDMIAIHNLAWMWWFTGDSTYARKATNILDGWAVTNTTWGGNESMLDIGDYAQYWGVGAEILRSTFPGWTAANTQHVKNYFANVLFPTSWVPGPLRDANKGALQLKIALAASVFCDDATRFNQAVDVYRMDAGGGMRNSLPDGEIGDSGRDDHWRVQATALAWGAEVAYKQGVDMFAELDNRVLAIGELYHKYAFDGATMTYIPLGGYASYWTSWGIQPGARTGDMTNLIYSAYAVRKGIPTPNTDRMRAALMQPGATNYSPAGGDFLYLKSSDTSNAVKLPAVYYPADHVQAVSNLTNIDIGNTGLAGNASFNNGIWTLKGAGTSTSNAFSFTFKKVSGDAGLVVKVENMSLNTGGCGVMLRESLAPGSAFYDLYLNATGGAGRHWQPKAPWWLKIERVGTRIFVYHTQDGVNWTNDGCWYSATGFPTNLYAGFYTLSNNTSALNTATFSNVAYSQTAPAGSPDITSATTATATIGTPFSYSIIASANASSYSASGLPTGLSINTATGVISGTPSTTGQSEITIAATNASGTGTATLMLNAINNETPPAPTSAAASIVNTQINLTWVASANATSYSVKRSLTPGGTYATIQTGITGTGFTDVSPIPEVNNYYVITALTGDKESGNSNEVFAAVPPTAPAQPSAVNKNNEVDLSWNSASGAATYNVKRATVSGGPYTTIVNVSTNSYADINVSNGNPYYYVVSSVGATKESANSPEAFGVPGSNSFVWNPTAITDSLNLAGNWVENTVPVNPAIITFGETRDSTLTNNITGLAAPRIQFSPDANANNTISGNALTLKNDLVNNSTKTQTLSTPIQLTDQLNVNTKGDVVLNGGISGSGSLMKSGAAALYVRGGNNSYTGNTIIVGGTLAAAGLGTGTASNPTAGPLGTGKIQMSGGALQATAGADLLLYNDIQVLPGTSYMYEDVNSITLYGKLLGSGTLQHDGNDYAGLNLLGDNSQFAGTFISKLRSGRQRIRFGVPESGSANATWLLDANAVDCQGIGFSNGTLNFGALNGRGYIRADAGGAPVISIGALNTYSSYGGTINANGSGLTVVKIGTGVLEMWGNQAYGGTTTVKGGKLLINNNPSNGVFSSPVIIEAGSLGGFGVSQSSATLGTGSGAGTILEPGFLKVGTLSVGALIMNSDATYTLELDYGAITGDRVIVTSANLVNHPALAITPIAGTLPSGTSFTIIDNTGSNPISGTFKNLPEMGLVNGGAYNFRITYKGGTGNDVVLLDDRTLGVTITSALIDTVLVGRPMTYTVTGIKSPNYFSASGLPAGLRIDSLSGKISGTPSVTGVFNVMLTAGNGNTTGTATLVLNVQSRTVGSLIVAAGDAKNILEWQPINGFSYNLKRASVSGGPYTTIGTTGSPTYTDSNVTNGNTYFYVVTSVDSTGESDNSLEIVAKPNLGQQEFYQVDETGGLKGIDAWGANHAVLAVAASRSAGKYGQSLLLNGSATAYATLPAGIFSNLNDFTISAWVRMDAISTWMRVFDFGASTTQYMFLTVQAGVSSGKSIIRYGTKNGSAAEQSLSYNYTFPLNTWTYLAVTRAGNTTTLYLNGTSVASSTNITIKPSALSNTSLNYLGKSQFSDPMFKGSIDNFKIYGRALNSSEITADMLGDQAISFAAMPVKVLTDADFVPVATTTSGLPLSFTSSDTTVAVILNGKVHVKSAGTTVINASQPGNTSYKAATSLNQPLTVQKASQTITFAAIPDKILSDTDFSAGAISSSGLAVSYASSDTSVVRVINNNLHIAGAGRATVTASQTGNAIYTAAPPLSQNVTIHKLEQTISFTALPAGRPGDPDLLLNGSASSGLQINYSSSNTDVAIILNNKLHILGPGTSIITAGQNGNTQYSAAAQSQNFTVLPYNIHMQSLDGDNGQLTNNLIKPYLKISNQDSVAVKYSELTARYWFTAENYAGINTYIDYAQLGTGNITATYIPLPNPRSNAFGYVEYAFAATTGNLNPGSTSGAIQSRFGNSDWSNLSEANDYSYRQGSAVYADNPNITLYRNGVLIWGTEPVLVDKNRQVKVYTENKTSSGNTISIYLSIDNQGNVPLNYKDLSIRYFFTNDGSKPLNYWIDYAKIGISKINGQIGPFLPADTMADTYFQLSVDSSAGKLYPLSTTGNIQYRIAKTDWSAFTQTNDYSYQSGTSRENPHICVYYQNQLIYGTEPSGSVLSTAAFHSKMTGVSDNPNNVIPEISIAKAVSPNGDGINDFLIIEGITSFPNNKLTVVNRTGSLMAEIRNYNNVDKVFNGRSTGGQLIAAGTYLYLLEYVDNSGKKVRKTGYFLLKYND